MALPVESVSRTGLLSALLAAPELASVIRNLSHPEFAALVREVGVADAGEMVALATTPQLVALFDADLFLNPAPGQREVFDARRFITWVEVLSEAGSAAIAQRFTELSEDFVSHAFSQLLLVLDHDALQMQMIANVQVGRAVEAVLEGNLYEEIDGYLLLARTDEGWDALLSLILALDRDHREVLERILDRCVAVTRGEVGDLEELSQVLSEGASLGEDVEAEREERRSGEGYVEPRAARAFLQQASEGGGQLRDPLTQAYFRDFPSTASTSTSASASTASTASTASASALSASTSASISSQRLAVGPGGPAQGFPALQELQAHAPEAFGQRLAELAYLANVLLAGAQTQGRRYQAAEAAQAALATVAYGAELEAQRHAPQPGRARSHVLREVLTRCPADQLFRRACATLTAMGRYPGRTFAVLHTQAELVEVLAARPAVAARKG